MYRSYQGRPVTLSLFFEEMPFFSTDTRLLRESGWLEFARLENDGLENNGLEQEQTYVLHTLKTFNVYDM